MENNTNVINNPQTTSQQQATQPQPSQPTNTGWGTPAAPAAGYAPGWGATAPQPPAWGTNPNQGAPAYNWTNPGYGWNPNNGPKLNPTTSLTEKDIAILKSNKEGMGSVFYRPPKEGFELASYRCNHHGPNGEFLPFVIDSATNKVQCPQCGAVWIMKDPNVADINELENCCSEIYDWVMSMLCLDINPNKTLYEGLFPTFISVIKQLPHMYKYVAAISQKFYNQNGNGYNQYNGNNAEAYLASIMQGTPLPGNGMLGAMYNYNNAAAYGGYGYPAAPQGWGQPGAAAPVWPPTGSQPPVPPAAPAAPTGWGAQAPMTYAQPQGQAPNGAVPVEQTPSGAMPNPIGQKVENVSVNIPGTQPSSGSFTIN